MPESKTKGLLNRFRSPSTGRSKVEHESAEELITAESFAPSLICRRGFPYRPTCLAFDPVQSLIAIGCSDGSVRIFGRAGVDFYLSHESKSAVRQLIFLINEGAFISVCEDNCIHLWSIRQKTPNVVHTLQFQREQIKLVHLPFQSKWLYTGTDKGNVHVISVETFKVSGYSIPWNKAIFLSQRNHPGPIVHLSVCPIDDNKILIGFESGTIVVWDLKNRQAEARYQAEQTLRCLCWHMDGKQFASGHADGSLSTWQVKKSEPVETTFPHMSTTSGRKKQTFRPIECLEWMHRKNNDEYLIFSGGCPVGDNEAPSYLSVVKNKSVTVIELERKIVAFVVVAESPYCLEPREPYAVGVVLEDDFLLVDLDAKGFPCFENPHAMDVHQSPITCCMYMADSPTDLIPAFYSVGAKQKRNGYSEKVWPLRGGEKGASSLSYPEILVTGHVDGSVKIWDFTSVNLQVLYKLKACKYIEKTIDADRCPSDVKLMAIDKIFICAESRHLVTSFCGGCVVVWKFSRSETTIPNIPSLNIIPSDSQTSKPINDLGTSKQRSASSSSLTNMDSDCAPFYPLKLQSGQHKLSCGYQPELICLVPWKNCDTAPSFSALSLNSSYGLVAMGVDSSLVVVDYVHKIVVFNICVHSLYSSLSKGERILRKNASSESEPYHSPVDRSEFTQNSLSVDAVSPPVASSNSSKFASVFSSNHHSGKSGSFSNLQKLRYSERTKGQGSNLLRRPFIKAQSVAVVDDGTNYDFLTTPTEKEYSRTSSSSSQENLDASGGDTATSLSFVDTLVKKGDEYTHCLWVGTGRGFVGSVGLKIPEQRNTQPVAATNTGLGYQPKNGSVLCLGFLDHSGSLLQSPYEPFKDNKTSSKVSEGRASSSPGGAESAEVEGSKQWLIVCSERQVDVYLLSSPHKMFAKKFDQPLLRAEVISMNDGPFVVGYSSDGRTTAYSLPSLRLLSDVTNFPPLCDNQLLRNMRFSRRGHCLYTPSPSELVKYTLSSEMASQIIDLNGELFQPRNTPEPPKQNFLKGIFGSKSLDREELFGGSPACSGVAKPVQSRALGELQAQTGSSPFSAARQALNERTEKLSEVEQRTEAMKESGRGMANQANELLNTFRSKNRWFS